MNKPQKVLFIGGPWDHQRKPPPARDELAYDSDGVPCFRLLSPPKMSRRRQYQRIIKEANKPGFVPGQTSPRLKKYSYTERAVIAGNTEIRFWALKDIETDEALKRIFGDVSVHTGPVVVCNQPIPIK